MQHCKKVGVSVLLCLFISSNEVCNTVCLSVCHFVLVCFSPFSIAITSLGEGRANLSAFRTFVRFVLVWICRFPLPLGVWEGLRFVIVALPGLFSYLFFFFFFFFFFLYKHLYNHLRDINILSSLQSGFIQGDSTINQLTFLYIHFVKP